MNGREGGLEFVLSPGEEGGRHRAVALTARDVRETQLAKGAIFAGLAMMTAAMTAVGQNMGARNPDRAAQSCYSVARISLTLSALLGGLCIVFASTLVGFFTQDAQARHWGVLALRIVSLSVPFATVSMAFSGALRGAGDTLSPMWATIVCTLVIGPVVGYLLALTGGLGPVGAWIGLLVSMVAQAALTGFVFRRGKWRSIAF